VSIAEIIPAGFAGTALRPQRVSIALPTLPAVAPGQVWLVELADDASPPAVADVLREANVVIYDRTAAEAVAGALPLGTYAEPATTPESAAARAVRFARDGWSVVRVLRSRLSPRERTRRLQDIVDELAAAGVAGRLPVQLLAEAADGIEEHVAARFDDLAAVVASFPRDTRLTVAVAAFGDAAGVGVQGVAANGLAG